MRKKTTVTLTMIIATLVLVMSCQLSGEDDVTVPDEIITSFSLDIDTLGAGVEIDGNDIIVTVPDGTTLTALAVEFSVAGISIQVGGVEQVSGVTTNDYTNPVTFTVTASDGTTKDYTVTVRLGGYATLRSPEFIGGTFATFLGSAYSYSSAIIGMGLCYNTTGNPDIGDSIQSFVISDPNNVTIERDIDPINENTVYYVRSYVTNAEGTVYSVERSFNSGYAIGTNHAGGLVFYNDGAGGGLIAAAANQDTGSGSLWIAGGAASTTFNAGATSQTDGLANSEAIAAQIGHTSSAAQLSLDYFVDSFDDWYLPTKSELIQMMHNLTHYASSADFASSNYWSSTQPTGSSGDTNAWAVYGTSSESQIPFEQDKDASYKVRAIREF